MFVLALILVGLWLLGILSSSTMGGLIHILLIAAIIITLVRIISGKRIL